MVVRVVLTMVCYLLILLPVWYWGSATSALLAGVGLVLFYITVIAEGVHTVEEKLDTRLAELDKLDEIIELLKEKSN
jgi:hypothetical protein